MTKMKQPKRRHSVAKRVDQTPTSDSLRELHELELRAIEEQFLAEYKAGLTPLLSTYVERYLDYGAELAAFVACTFTPASQPSALLLMNDSAAESHERGGAFSSGTRRALEEIFGSDRGRSIHIQSRVAEQRASYTFEAPSAPLAEDAKDIEQ